MSPNPIASSRGIRATDFACFHLLCVMAGNMPVPGPF